MQQIECCVWSRRVNRPPRVDGGRSKACLPPCAALWRRALTPPPRSTMARDGTRTRLLPHLIRPHTTKTKAERCARSSLWRCWRSPAAACSRARPAPSSSRRRPPAPRRGGFSQSSISNQFDSIHWTEASNAIHPLFHTSRNNKNNKNSVARAEQQPLHAATISETTAAGSKVRSSFVTYAWQCMRAWYHGTSCLFVGMSRRCNVCYVEWCEDRAR